MNGTEGGSGGRDLEPDDPGAGQPSQTASRSFAGRVLRRTGRTLRTPARRLAAPLRSRFRRGLEDLGTPISLDLSETSEVMLIAFGGLQGQLGMPAFEFFRSTAGLRVKRLFVRDLHQAWYHLGIPGHGDGLPSSAQSLLALAHEHGARRIVLVGNSAGGYAALVYGVLMGADVAIAFAPQTVVDTAVLAAWDDHRWDAEMAALHASGGYEPAWGDLRDALPAARALPSARAGATAYEVYFDPAYEPDRLHAERVAAVPGLRLHERGGEHDLVRRMRASGELERVLRAALAPEGSLS